MASNRSTNRRPARQDKASADPDPTPVVDVVPTATDTPVSVDPIGVLTAAAASGPDDIVTAFGALSRVVRGQVARGHILTDPTVLAAVAPHLTDPAVLAAWDAFRSGGVVADPATTARVAVLAAQAVADAVAQVHGTADLSAATDDDRAAAAAMADRMLTAAGRGGQGGSGARTRFDRDASRLAGTRLTYRGVTGTVTPDGGVRIGTGRDAVTHPSLSAAAVAVARDAGVARPSVNGWDAWRTTDGTRAAAAYDAAAS
jgi:hypothetical protein